MPLLLTSNQIVLPKTLHPYKTFETHAWQENCLEMLRTSQEEAGREKGQSRGEGRSQLRTAAKVTGKTTM